jgi:hypothetical protein
MTMAQHSFMRHATIFSGPGAQTRPRQSCRLKSHRKDTARKYHHLMGIIKHNEAARSQSVKNKIAKLRQICDFRDSGIFRINPRA